MKKDIEIYKAIANLPEELVTPKLRLPVLKKATLNCSTICLTNTSLAK